MNITSQIDCFAKLVSEGIKKWEQAGKLLVALSDADPSVYSKITQRHPFVSMDMLMAFEKIGRKQLHPILLLSDSPAARKASTLPYQDQKKIIESGIYVLDQRTSRPQKRTLDDLTARDVRMAFSDSSIRTVEEQARLKEEIEKEELEARKTRLSRYVITGGTVTFFHNSVFTKSELEAILDEWPAVSAGEIQDSLQRNQVRSSGASFQQATI